MRENKKFHVIVDKITFRRANVCAFRFFVNGVLYCVQRKRRVFAPARSGNKIRRPGDNNRGSHINNKVAREFLKSEGLLHKLK